MADIEMKDASKDDKKSEGDDKVEKKEPSDKFYELKKVLVLLERAAIETDQRQTTTLTK